MSNWSKQLNNDNPRKIKDNAKKAQVQLWKKFLEIMFTIYIYIYKLFYYYLYKVHFPFLSNIRKKIKLERQKQKNNHTIAQDFLRKWISQ